MAIITDQPYHHGESVGMAVSRSSHTACPALADHMRTLSSPGSRCLWYAFLDLGLGHVRHPWGMSRPAREQDLNVRPAYPASGFSIFRCPWHGAAVLRMKRSSFSPTQRNSSLPFSCAISLKPLVRSSASPG